MEFMVLDIMLLSAKGLHNVKHFSKMDVYAIATYNNNAEQKTHVDKHGGPNPTWDFPMQFFVEESSLFRTAKDPALIFHLRCDRAVRGDKDVGEIEVPIKGLWDGKSSTSKVVTYHVNPKGELKFSYKFEGKVVGAGANDCGVSETNHMNTPITENVFVAYPPKGYNPPVGYPPISEPEVGYPLVGYPLKAGYFPVVVQSGAGNPCAVMWISCFVADEEE